MSVYDDQSITLGDDGITIKSYVRPGRSRHIRYEDLAGASLVTLRFGTGRYRLVGYSPGRPRHFFHWDPHRSSKTQAVSLDVGRWRRIAITPDDPVQVHALIEARTG